MYGITRLPWRPLWTCYLEIPLRSKYKRFDSNSTRYFAYEPLRANEIRILDLLPGHDKDPVRCGVHTVELSKSSRYETLSYCWGLNQHENEIECDGGALPVTKDLYAALQHVRDGERLRTLWIDAICINQANIEERGQQVSFMKDIFEVSERTVVWLGEQSHDSEAAFDLVRQLVTASQSDSRGWRSHVSTHLPPLYAPAWKAFADLLLRPWWHRAWIVQEAAVAQDILVVCGKQSIPWNDLVQAIQYAVDLGVFIAYGGSTAYQALRLFEMRANFQSRRLPPLHQILLRNRSFLATDSRDKVFGLLALASPESVKAMKIKPNYYQKVDELYKQVALSLLEQPDLSAFSASGVHQNSQERSLPSWVSDWSASDPSVPLTSPKFGIYEDRSAYSAPAVPDFNASKSTISSPIFDHNKKLLGLEGVLFDQVEAVGRLSRTRYLRHVSHMFELFVQCHDILEQLKDWEQIARVKYWERQPGYPTGIKHRDAYWHTLCIGRVPPSLRSAKHDPRYKYYVIIRSLRTFVRLTIRWFPRTDKDTWYNRLFYSLFQNAWRMLGLTPAKIQRIGFPPESQLSNYRRMVRTKKGYIALAPRETKTGDWVAVCKGGKVPLVVRREGERCVLVGETYVHGIMNGEAWDEGNVKMMWFQ